MLFEGTPGVLLEALERASSYDLDRGVGIKEGFPEELMILLSSEG